jgi:hypothetical protein
VVRSRLSGRLVTLEYLVSRVEAVLVRRRLVVLDAVVVLRRRLVVLVVVLDAAVVLDVVVVLRRRLVALVVLDVVVELVVVLRRRLVLVVLVVLVERRRVEVCNDRRKCGGTSMWSPVSSAATRTSPVSSATSSPRQSWAGRLCTPHARSGTIAVSCSSISG